MIVVLISTGCTALQLYQTGSGAYNARGGVQGYQSLKMMRSIKDKTPVFKNYSLVLVSVETHPGGAAVNSINDTMTAAYCKNITGMAQDLDLAIACRPLAQADGASNEDSLIVSAEEQKLSTAGKIAQGSGLQAKIAYKDKKTGSLILEEDFAQLNTYADMADMLSMSAMVKMMNNGYKENATAAEKKEWDKKMEKFVNQDSQKYPALSAEDRKTLAQM